MDIDKAQIQIPGFTITKELGKGGMGSVFLGVQEKLNRKVAIKILFPHWASDSNVTKRFIKEAETSANLYHSNIVSIIDVGQTDEFYYIIMEYLEYSLRDILKDKALTINSSLDIVKKLSTALDFAHGKGFVHRDLKPENIMFRNDDTPVIVDFGIVKALDNSTRLTETGTSIGTPYYMSPEQARGHEIDGRCDFYSLGIVLYEMITGHVPYKGTDSVSTILQHFNEPIPTLNEEFSYLQPVINAMMAKKAGQRVKDGSDLLKLISTMETVDKKIGGGTTIITDNIETGSIEGQLGKKNNKKQMIVLAAIIAAAVIITGYFLPAPGKKDASTDNPVNAADKQEPIKKTVGAEDFTALMDKARDNLKNKNYQKALEFAQKAKTIINNKNIQALEKRIKQFLQPPPYIKAIEPLASRLDIPETGCWEAEFDNQTVMVYIPPGEFLMGSSQGEKDEKPAHSVKVDGFWMGKYEVTVEQYEAFIKDTGRKPLPDSLSDISPGKRYPVVGVSRPDALAYCSWLSKKTGTTPGMTGLQFALPSEAQWERAARGNTTAMYFWGNSVKDICNYANTADRSAKSNFPKWSSFVDCDDGYIFTAPVGSFKANPFGLYDITGNVMEWCCDLYDANYYGRSPSQNPVNLNKGSDYSLRGGCWGYAAGSSRISKRFHLKNPGKRYGKIVGFRICMKKKSSES
ncbi:MAG: SUMF1/EgtB/PvdO family nonheme iron enzyme [bacterium]|nr:SUMF1/EgtB/PvdO family nonheme iron enzyme [bacterium]